VACAEMRMICRKPQTKTVTLNVVRHFVPRMKLRELDEKISSIGFQGQSDAVIKLNWIGLRISRNWRYRDSTDFSLCLRNQFIHPVYFNCSSSR
jgi:hypothetical protein